MRNIKTELTKIESIQPNWTVLTDNGKNYYLRREVKDDIGTSNQIINYYPKTNTASIKVKAIVLDDAQAAVRSWRWENKK